MSRTRCVTCETETAITKCEGCLQSFCYNHWVAHREQLEKSLYEIEGDRDQCQQMFIEQNKMNDKNTLIDQINEWERRSIQKIRQTAKEARDMIVQYTEHRFGDIQVKLNQLTEQIRQVREKKSFLEIDIEQWKGDLTRLTDELRRSTHIEIREDSSPFVTKIDVEISSTEMQPTVPPPMSATSGNSHWKQNGITIAGNNERGDGLHQLAAPWGLYIDDSKETIYVADSGNHRIMAWKYGSTTGQLVAGGNGDGDRLHQLNWPRDVVFDKRTDSLIISDTGNGRIVRWSHENTRAGELIVSNVCSHGLTMDGDGCLYIPNYEKHEVRQWKIGDKSGTVVAGGNGQGNRLDQLDGPMYIYVDHDCSIYVSDERNHRVMKWVKGAKEGIVVAGGHGQGNSLLQLSKPRGVIVDQFGSVFVADNDNHRIMCWKKGATQGSVVVGGNGRGGQPNQLYYPQDISFDREGNLYVVDQANHRVQRFDID